MCVIRIEDFYCTPKLTGAVHFEPSNGPSGLVLHGRLTEYESEIPGRTRGVPRPEG
jgi:hypothetical protein